MKRWMKTIWKRLDRRLIGLICLMVIPINLLAILFSSIAVDESQQRVALAQIREFERLADQEREKVEAVEDWLLNRIEGDLQRLTSPGQFSGVYSIVLVNQMGGALNEQAVQGFCFVEEHREEEKLYIRGSAGLLGLGQTQELREELREANCIDTGIMGLIGGNYYYVVHPFRNDTIGFAVDLEKELAGWQAALLPDGGLAISDGETHLRSDAEGGLTRTECLPEKEALAKARIGEMTVYLLPSRNGGVPSALVWLQALAWGSLALLAALWLMIRRHVIAPIRTLQTGMEELERDVGYRIEDSAGTEDFAYLFASFNKMAEDIQLSHEKDIKLYETQLNNLKLQVNPHMLLNSLTMIYSMAQTKQYDLIQKFTMCLVEYFRYCLRENNTLVPLSSELRFVENYMELQKLRFPGELAGNYLVQDDLEGALIPPLLIQNFVENAAKYARVPGKTVEILIWVRKQDGRMHIDVTDTGKGISEPLLRRLNSGELYTDHNGVKHIGVWNCRRRLDAFFGREASITFTSAPDAGTTVHIILPLRYEGG